MKQSDVPRTSAAAAHRAKAPLRSRAKRTKALVAEPVEGGRSEYEIRSVTKALDLLEAICDEDVHEHGVSDEEVRVTQLSKRLGLSKSAVFRLLATFESRGYVERIAETGIYRIGLNAFEVGRRLLLRMGLLRHSRPVMEDLCRRCNEAVYLAIRRGSEFLFIDLVESAQQVKIASLVGKRFTLAESAPGRILLAYSAPAAARESEADADTLTAIRNNGYCYEWGGLGDMVCCVAAPFFASSGEVAGALCLVGPVYRMPETQMESTYWPLLKDACVALSSKLGYLQPYKGGVRL